MSADSQSNKKCGLTSIDNPPVKSCKRLVECSLKRPPEEEGIVGAKNQIKRQRVAKPKGKPRRPISGYNVFFKEERGRWNISSIQSGVENTRSNDDSAFRTMTKAIGKRWRELSADQKMRYEKVASEDMQRYRKEMNEYKQKMIRDTAIGRASLEGRLIKVSGKLEISYRDGISQQLPQTMKDKKGPQVSNPDIQCLAGIEPRNAVEMQAAQDTPFPKRWTASSDTANLQQAFSRTNSSILENLVVLQGRTSAGTLGSFMAASQYVDAIQQIERNEKAEENSVSFSKVKRLDPFTQSNAAAAMEADLQSYLSSLTQRQEVSRETTNRSTLAVTPSVPTDLISFLQQLLPSHLQDANRYVQSFEPIASSNVMMSENLSSRILQMLLHSAQDKRIPHIDATSAYSAHAATQHQPEFPFCKQNQFCTLNNLPLGSDSGPQTTRSVVDLLTSHSLSLASDQEQSLYSNIAMQLMQATQHRPSPMHPGHSIKPPQSSLWTEPGSTSMASSSIADFKIAADAEARAQIAFDNDYKITFVDGAAPSPLMRDIYSCCSSSHFPFRTWPRASITAAISEEDGRLTGQLVKQLLHVLLPVERLEHEENPRKL